MDLAPDIDRGPKRDLLTATSYLAIDPPADGDRLVYKAETVERTGRTYPTLWAWMCVDKFPRARVVGGRIAWLNSELEAWMESLPKQTLKGDPGYQRHSTADAEAA
jgi:predicted DNA-binding transcriptional regulator AlpA